MNLPFIPSALDDARLPLAEFRLYCHLVRRADNKEGLAYPSYESMAEACGLSRRSVARGLAELVRRKLVEKVGKPFGMSTRYRPLPIVPPEIRLTPNSATRDTIEEPPIVPPEPINSATRDTPIVPPGTREGAPIKVLQLRKDKCVISPEAIEFAIWFRSTLPSESNLKSNWQESFAASYEDLIRLDDRTPEQIRKVAEWGRASDFWRTNFMSPAKLRKRNRDGIQYFDVFTEKMRSEGPKQPGQQAGPRASLSLDKLGKRGQTTEQFTLNQ